MPFTDENLKLRKGKSLAKSHTATKWQSQDPNSSLLDSRSQASSAAPCGLPVVGCSGTDHKTTDGSGEDLGLIPDSFVQALSISKHFSNAPWQR